MPVITTIAMHCELIATSLYGGIRKAMYFSPLLL
jgi:hypothetical protein